MAKGDVTLKFDANTAEFIQKVVAARTVLDDTAKKARNAADDFKKAGDHASEFANKASEGVMEIAKLASLPVSIMGAVDLTLKAVENRIELAQERAKELLSRSATFDTAMYTLGTTRQSRGIRERLGELASKSYGGIKVDDGQVERLFAQIVAQVGPRASVDQFVSATKTALGAIGANANTSQAVEAGAGSAVLQSLMPNLSEDEADRMSRFMQLNAPGVLQDPKILGAIATSKDKMSAARFFASGYQEFQGAKRIKPITEFVEGRPGMTYEKLLENPLMLPPKERAVLQSIIEGQNSLRNVGSSDEAMSDAMAGTDEYSRAARVMRNSQTAQEQVLDINASEDTINEAIFTRAKARLKASSPVENFFTPDWVLRAQSRGEDSYLAGALGFEKGGPVDKARNEVLDELRALREATEAQTQIMRQQGPPLLKNDKEGQK